LAEASREFIGGYPFFLPVNPINYGHLSILSSAEALVNERILSASADSPLLDLG